MIALINEDQSKFVDVDNNRFPMALTISSEKDSLDNNVLTSMYFGEPFLSISPSNYSTTLQLTHNYKNSSQLTARGIVQLTSFCNSIRELSLPYSMLSEQLVKVLCDTESIRLETLRVEAHPDIKPASKVSHEAWTSFTNHFPNINFVLLTFLTEAKDYNELLVPYVPLTHLYFGDGVPSSVVEGIGERCPHLEELVIGAYGPNPIDETLISAARGCLRLSAVGLGDCELTCSRFIEFVGLCCERLKILYVSDTSLIENSEYSITEVAEKVSSLLGKSWKPNYVPYCSKGHGDER
ncbi:PREDICTED: F-box/LRR-repeat protein 3-like [Ceratosolen solmsi marchali]|uniref:F-box/LRR-repeat protein 3-like n=1 Tax=Ceratosolen solmsi marchali TaxID=326594 RepID=A0AAJ6YD88_9HYME|nr:PREDICTED: F-box/LRR-repeat protein 3-like [Ceratosolen solmsi marchali]